MRFGELSYWLKPICLGWERLEAVDMNPTEGLQQKQVLVLGKRYMKNLCNVSQV